MWDGRDETFNTQIMHPLDGCIHQNDASCLTITWVQELHKTLGYPILHHPDFKNSFPKIAHDQFRADNTWPYGLLKSMCACSTRAINMLEPHRDESNGLLAFMELQTEFGHKGSKSVELNKAEHLSHAPFQASDPTGLCKEMQDFAAACTSVTTIKGTVDNPCHEEKCCCTHLCKKLCLWHLAHPEQLTVVLAELNGPDCKHDDNPCRKALKILKEHFKESDFARSLQTTKAHNATVDNSQCDDAPEVHHNTRAGDVIDMANLLAAHVTALINSTLSPKEFLAAAAKPCSGYIQPGDYQLRKTLVPPDILREFEKRCKALPRHRDCFRAQCQRSQDQQKQTTDRSTVSQDLAQTTKTANTTPTTGTATTGSTPNSTVPMPVPKQHNLANNINQDESDTDTESATEEHDGLVADVQADFTTGAPAPR